MVVVVAKVVVVVGVMMSKILLKPIREEVKIPFHLLIFLIVVLTPIGIGFGAVVWLQDF